jgi:hypothetical protein
LLLNANSAIFKLYHGENSSGDNLTDATAFKALLNKISPGNAKVELAAGW